MDKLERRNYILKQRANGRSLREIGEELGVSRQRIYSIAPVRRRRKVALFIKETVELPKRTAQRRALTASVYFVRCRTAVKVGVSMDIKRRLEGLRAGCPEPVELLATFPGGRALEEWIHAKLASCRLHHEWFQACPAVDHLILELNEKGVPSIDRILGDLSTRHHVE